MKKGLKLVLSACLALVFVFTLASCNKGTCNGCFKKDVSRTKVQLSDNLTVYYCKDCYQKYKDTKKAIDNK